MHQRNDILIPAILPNELEPYETFLRQYTNYNLAFRNAAHQGNTDLIRVLRNFANINSFGVSGCTALHYAYQSNNIKTIRLLIELGSSSVIVDNKGRYPFELARKETIKKLGFPLLDNTVFSKDSTIVINTVNINGIGDAIYALRAHMLCQRLLPKIACKTIITLDSFALASFNAATNGDISQDDIYIYHVEEIFNDRESMKKPFILFVTDPEAKKPFFTQKFIGKNAPELDKFIFRSERYFNFATKLTDARNIPPIFEESLKTNVFSFLELGKPHVPEMDSNYPDSQLAKWINETDMGFFDGSAGIMMDESLQDVIATLPVNELTPSDFNNPTLFSVISKAPGYFLAGYLQTFSAVSKLIHTYAEKFSSLKILTNTKIVKLHHLSQYPMNTFSSVSVFNEFGKVVLECHNQNAKFEQLQIFPLNGLTNQDKRRYLLLAGSTLGSGDNSFIESITLGKPFFWDIPLYKIPFMSKLAIWCCHKKLFSLAKMIYLNVLLSGDPTTETLNAYSEFLQNVWEDISIETKQLCALVTKETNFKNLLISIMCKSDAKPYITSEIKEPVVNIGERNISQFRLFSMQECSKNDMQMLLQTSNPQKLLPLIERLPNKIVLNKCEFTQFILADSSATLKYYLEIHPLTDLMESMNSRIPLEVAMTHKVTHSFNLLIKLHIQRGEATLVLNKLSKQEPDSNWLIIFCEQISRLSVDKRTSDFLSPIALIAHSMLESFIEKNKSNQLLEVFREKQYGKALRMICNSVTNMTLRFEKILLQYRSILNFNIDEQAGSQNYAAIHYAAKNVDSKVYEELVKHGANKDLRDSDGISAEELKNEIVFKKFR